MFKETFAPEGFSYEILIPPKSCLPSIDLKISCIGASRGEISTISISIGALLLYIIANFFFKDLIKPMFMNKFEKYIEKFKKNEFYYFLAFRLCGGLGIPFALQNILPVIFNMKRSNYFFASFFGFIPMFFIWNAVGSGINNYIKNSDNFSFINLIMNKEIYFPILIFLFFICISIAIKNFFFK